MTLNLPEGLPSADFLCVFVQDTASRSAGYIRGSAPNPGHDICEALPRAPLRTFFEKKVLRTPKNF